LANLRKKSQLFFAQIGIDIAKKFISLDTGALCDTTVNLEPQSTEYTIKKSGALTI
jgi:hypothetical protein